MKVEELRIGNLIYIRSTAAPDRLSTSEVTGINNDNNVKCLGNSLTKPGLSDIMEFDIEEISPIPLTDQWLGAFGFAFKRNSGHHNKDLYYFEDDLLSIFYDSKDYFLGTGDEFCDCVKFLNSRKIEFVHQLQNLYFAVTGLELKIKS